MADNTAKTETESNIYASISGASVSVVEPEVTIEMANSGRTNLPPKFVGMGKDELLQYANDPFWVRMRWAAFILFWAIWLGMLAGAVVIVVNAPKNDDYFDGPAEGPYYQIYLNSFAENGLFNELELEQEIKYLVDLGIKTVIISQVLKTEDGAANSDLSKVVDFMDVSSRHGTLAEFDSLIKRFTDLENPINVVLQIIPNHSSNKHPWYTNDETRDTNYVLLEETLAQEYTWRNYFDESAWDLHDVNSTQMYLHQFAKGEPDLDYGNTNVINQMNSVLEFWTKKQIKGFLLSDVSYLLEDLKIVNSSKAHINQPGNLGIIQKLLDSSSWDVSDAPYALLDVNWMTLNDSLQYYTEITSPISTNLHDQLAGRFDGLKLQQVVETIENATDPHSAIHWRLSGPRISRSSYVLGQERNNVLALVTFLLRGQVIIYYGDEYGITPNPVGSLDKSTEKFYLAHAATPTGNETLQYYKDLIALHNELDQPYHGPGETVYNVTETVPDIFIMKRTVAERQWLVIVNFGDKDEHKVDISEYRPEEEILTVKLITINLKGQTKLTVGSEFEENVVTLPPFSGVVLALPDL